jgi:hypothetical protein
VHKSARALNEVTAVYVRFRVQARIRRSAYGSSRPCDASGSTRLCDACGSTRPCEAYGSTRRVTANRGSAAAAFA